MVLEFPFLRESTVDPERITYYYYLTFTMLVVVNTTLLKYHCYVVLRFPIPKLFINYLLFYGCIILLSLLEFY